MTRTQTTVSILPWTLNLKNAGLMVAVCPVQKAANAALCVPDAYPHWLAQQPALIFIFFHSHSVTY